MPTGLEEIGLILAVIPLFISAAEHYQDGLEPIRRAFHMPFELKKFYRALDEQRVQLRMSLIKLFGEMPSLSEEQRRVLSDEDENLAPLLEDEDLQCWAHEQLGLIYRPYMDNLDSMMEALSKLVEKDKSLRLSSMTKSGKEELEQLLQECETIGFDDQIMRRVRFSRSSKRRTKLLTEIQTCNDKLQSFSNQSNIVRPIMKSWHTKVPKSIHNIPDHARDLYNAIISCWRCTCCMPYTTLLRLESRNKLETSSNLCFKLAFGKTITSNSKWQQLEVSVIQPREALSALRSGGRFDISGNTPSHTKPKMKGVRFNQAPGQTPAAQSHASTFSPGFGPPADPDSLSKIDSICGIVVGDETCRGITLQNGQVLRGCYPASRWHKAFTPNLVSLNSLLGTLRHAERLQLALNLASTLLQLHQTPWLNDRWTARDIKFSAKTSATLSQDVVQTRSHESIIDASQPLLTNVLSHNSSLGAEPELPAPTHPNISVLCLGIMLLEVYFGHSIEEEWQPEDLSEGKPNSSTNWSAAKRWLDRENNGMSVRQGYWKATFHCVHCFFDPMPQRMDLRDKDFREVLYLSVVLPLEKELKAWNSSP